LAQRPILFQLDHSERTAQGEQKDCFHKMPYLKKLSKYDVLICSASLAVAFSLEAANKTPVSNRNFQFDLLKRPQLHPILFLAKRKLWAVVASGRQRLRLGKL
jgi:hypothetical protein